MHPLLEKSWNNYDLFHLTRKQGSPTRLWHHKWKIRHPGTLEYYYFETKEDAMREMFEGFNMPTKLKKWVLF